MIRLLVFTLVVTNLAGLIAWATVANAYAMTEKSLADLRRRLPDIRQAEVDAYSAWLTENAPILYLQYAQQRHAEIDKTRVGDV